MLYDDDRGRNTMPRFLVPFVRLLAFALVGCQFAQVSHGADLPPVPVLAELHSEFFPNGIKIVEYSSDGKTLIVGNEGRFVGLYSAHDYTLLEKHDGPDPFSVRGAGFINANTWYFATHTYLSKKEDPEGKMMVVHFRTIHPPNEISTHTLEDNGSNVVVANENYIANDNKLFNWHNGQTYRVRVAGARFYDYILTRNNRVLTTGWHDSNYGHIQIDDPVNGKTVQLDEGNNTVAITPDDRHLLIVRSNGICKLLKLPEKEVVGNCGSRALFFTYDVRSSIAPDGTTFAASRDKKIKIYRIDPFQIEQEMEMLGNVNLLVLSDNGWLAAIDRERRLRLWDVATGTLAAQYDLTPTKDDFIRLVFQPGGRHLAVVSEKMNTLKILQLPERPGP
jgi:WD40 repeat protein